MKILTTLRTTMVLLIMCFSFSTAVVYSPGVHAKFDVPQKIVDKKDKTEIAKVANKAVTFVLYAVVALGVVSLAVSLGAMLPLVGKTEEGKKYAKGSIGVILCAALFEMGITELFSWFGAAT